jgi:hypothetical protein
VRAELGLGLQCLENRLIKLVICHAAIMVRIEAAEKGAQLRVLKAHCHGQEAIS